jgi:peroxiredoxin
MKNTVFLIALSFIIFSCSKVAKGEYLISGDAKGIVDGKMVILKTQNENGIIFNLDTVKVKDGKFEIKGKVKEPSMFALFVSGIQQPVPFILETGEISVKIDKDSIWKSKVSGTYSNDAFQTFNENLNVFQKKLLDYQNNNVQKLIAAQQKKDKLEIENLNKGYSSIQKNMDEYMTKYPDENPRSFISLLLLERTFSSPTFNLDKVKKTFNNFDESLKITKPGILIAKKLKVIEDNKKKIKSTNTVELLKKAPDFTAKDPNGKIISLKQSLGKVTIIDFWASWCGPCRKENPNVVALYNEFHSKGLNIIGVSLDNELNEWKNAIQKDKITWTQVSNLKKWSDPVAKLYEVEQIPSTFILDSNGTIVAKDLRGEELKAKIKELLGS